ncbi:hypothetical protein [Synechococcus sp. W4D4]|uniref:hypothetical protein n=1 Tax=Synechococcus sp. W4D4 TaxID=3392294 RepID=UPI0039EC693B
MPDSYDDWSSERPERPAYRRGERRTERGLDQRMDQWVSAGRQLVDGVSGARPGARRSSSLRLDQVGRWVEDKIDWLLEDDDGWRESWEEPSAPQRRRQPLDAISRRGRSMRPNSAPAPVRMEPQPTAPVPAPAQEPVDPDAWPEDENFTLNRWKREASPRMPERSVEVVDPQPFDAGLGRSLPRSTRRRVR